MLSRNPFNKHPSDHAVSLDVQLNFDTLQRERSSWQISIQLERCKMTRDASFKQLLILFYLKQLRDRIFSRRLRSV